MAKIHNGEAVRFIPGRHGRPHLPAHVQMMVQAPPLGTTGHVLDTYHDAAQVRWDDGVTTVVHKLDLVPGEQDVRSNPSFREYGREARDDASRQWREDTRVTFAPRGSWTRFYSPRHLADLPPSGTHGRVVSVRAGGRHSTTSGMDNSWVNVQWPNGAVVPVAREDLTRR